MAVQFSALIKGASKLRAGVSAVGEVKGLASDDDSALRKVLIAVLASFMSVCLLVTAAFGSYNLSELSDVEREVAMVLIERGYGNAAVAAIMGNVKQESGFDPRSGYPSGAACGLAQWGNGMDGSAWQALEAWALGEGLDPFSATTQAVWLCDTLPAALDAYTGRGTYTYPNGTQTWWPERVTIDEYKAMADVDAATEIFCNTYERPSVPAMDARKRYANEYLAKLTSGGEVRGADYATASEKGRAIVDAAYSTPSPGLNWCAAWVSNVYQNAGLPRPGGDACDMYWNWCTSSDPAQLQVGMMVATARSSSNPSNLGYIYGHVGIYVGDNKVIHNVGSIQVTDLNEWCNTYARFGSPAKWGWPG